MFPGGAGAGGGGAGGSSGWVWWWGRGRRVSRERLVEEALELTFRLIMSGDAALDALKVNARGWFAFVVRPLTTLVLETGGVCVVGGERGFCGACGSGLFFLG